ncbi:glycosyltransferase family 4 protein [Marinilactibacillus psychrotolerans]|uniref:glycosyltransferase family 4 protein n=1 Tax=Marinilactibacillus psychrotolerans TaxID=191770 RepID=UPI00388470AA
MKILVVSNMYPNEENPSFGTFVKNQVEMLESNGNKIDLKVIYKTNDKLKKTYYYLKHYFDLLLLLQRNDYDIIIVHYASLNALPFIIYNVFNKVENLIINVHGSDVIPETTVQEKLNFFTKKFLPIAKNVIVPSEYYRQIVTKKYGISTDNIYVSPSGGVNKNVFFEMNNISTSKKFTIGFVGRIDIGKGWDDMLEAFSLLIKNSEYSDSHLIMVGNGKLSAKRDQLIQSLNLSEHVTIYDSKSHQELAVLYNMLDVFVFPTKRSAESLGLVGLEAMACGVPVIGSDIGGLKSYIKDGINGFLFEPSNKLDLLDKIIKFRDLSEFEIDDLKNNALLTSEEFESGKIKKEFIAYIDGLKRN